MKTFNAAKLQKIVEETAAKKQIYGAVFHVSTGDGNHSWCGASGNLKTDSRYYIASINKLLVSALVLKLISQGRLSFETPLHKHVPEHIVEGLHVYHGKEYSYDITIQHLLSQTSGLPCYLSGKPKNGMSGMKELEAGHDRPWPIEQAIERAKALEPHFPPGEGDQTKYVDTNHQLLNLVIEDLTGESVRLVLNRMFRDLGMDNTYVCEDVHDESYVFPYYKGEIRDISQFITSTNNDVISTAEDQMRFIKAFFNGSFYSKERLPELEKWKAIFFPFKYGIGLQKFYMPRYLSPMRNVPDMIGHCGSTGAVAFYVPDRDFYITGTTNQQSSPNIAFQALIKIIHALE